jgi:hypothetical protein
VCRKACYRHLSPAATRYNTMLIRASGHVKSTISLFLSAWLLLTLSCAGDESEDLTGVWEGSFNQIAQDRSGTIRLELSQSITTLGGRWTITIRPDLTWEGRLEGTVTGLSIRARLLPDDAEICPYLWTATADKGRLQGPYEAYDCRVEIRGRIDVRAP